MTVGAKVSFVHPVRGHRITGTLEVIGEAHYLIRDSCTGQPLILAIVLAPIFEFQEIEPPDSQSLAE